MKVPPCQYEATVAFYRDIVGLKPVSQNEATGFELGPPIDFGSTNRRA
jgi:hypothetical protein